MIKKRLKQSENTLKSKKNNKYININQIHYGWLTLKIGKHSFRASYLDDVIEVLDDLFYFKNEQFDKAKRYIFDSEGGNDLNLITYITEEDRCEINIVWQILYGNKKRVYNIKFPYVDFYDKYRLMRESIKYDYINNFLLPQGKEEYNELLKKYENR